MSAKPPERHLRPLDAPADAPEPAAPPADPPAPDREASTRELRLRQDAWWAERDRFEEARARRRPSHP